VGPPDVASGALLGDHGWPVRSPVDVDAWVATVPARDRAEPFTYVVGVDGVLRLAPRRSEHVACAGGADVLAAGEISLVARPSGWAVGEVTNQSTGYCPDPSSWPAVAAALDRAGLARPDRFTSEYAFRRCPACGALNLVKDGDFSCGVCGADLPGHWNVDAEYRESGGPAGG
jgi:hypothetical protein